VPRKTATTLDVPPDLAESSGIAIRDTFTSRGRGAFARRSFRKGELVEVAPVLLLRCEFDDLPELLKTYVFNWESLAGIKNAHAIALGYGSMYNHANPASLCYEADPRAGTMRYIAARAIKAGEELTINYNADGGAAKWHDNNWFERMDIALIET
jgi:SET domain-containing protein